MGGAAGQGRAGEGEGKKLKLRATEKLRWEMGLEIEPVKILKYRHCKATQCTQSCNSGNCSKVWARLCSF